MPGLREVPALNGAAVEPSAKPRHSSSAHQPLSTSQHDLLDESGAEGDLVIQCKDGQCSAPSQVLRIASPVLRGLLGDLEPRVLPVRARACAQCFNNTVWGVQHSVVG